MVVRTRPADVDATALALAALPGVEVAARAGPDDGRLVVVIEDSGGQPAAATMAEVALWPQVLNTSLVYEYSGPDVGDEAAAVERYTDWRATLSDLASRHSR